MDAVRTLIGNGCEQLVIIDLIPGRLGMFIDNFAVLKGMRGQPQRYWRFKDGREKVAGRAVLVAVDLASGYLAPIREEHLEAVAGNVLWLPDVQAVRIVEEVHASPGETPILRYRTVFSDERLDDGAPQPPAPIAEAAPPPDRPMRWVVSATASGVKAVRYELHDGEDALRVAEAITAKDLEELRPLLPGGLLRVEPQDDDPPEILEYLVMPGPAPAEETA